ncbi:ZIP zinc transporter-domain-containing protein [Peziza echinospora]|nr:ZIP zinc transporter-domain-containing protein [Peziza echinospora]
MEGLFTLILFCIAMGLASFGAGMLPLTIPLSPGRMRVVSTIGMGVLVGTSLIVIIPEGINTLYSIKAVKANNLRIRERDIVWTGTAGVIKRWSSPEPKIDVNSLQKRGAEDVGYEVVDIEIPHGSRRRWADEDHPGTRIPRPPATHTSGGDSTNEPTHKDEDEDDDDSDSDDDDDDDDDSSGSSKKHSHKPNPHKYIGISLISGFILMYLIDTVPPLIAKGSSKPSYIALTSFSISNTTPPSSSSNNNTTSASATTPSSASILSENDITTSPPSAKSFSTTTGLVIHAAADGIALGAASTAKANLSLSFIIFVAIMLHKGPAAFGLSAVLLKKGLTKRQTRNHLLVFSLAAPVGALITWALIGILAGGGGVNRVSMQWWTGVLLLFSGGTFLYVAMHTMQDVEKGHGAHQEHQGFEEDIYLPMEEREKPGRTMWDTGAAVVGMLLPLLTQVGGHGH